MNQNISLIEGDIKKSLVRFTMPILFALLLQIMYSSVDMLIVGNFSDVANISGVSTGSQLMTTLTALCVGLAMGTTILLGQKLGENKQEEVRDIVVNSMILFTLISVATMLFFLLYKDGFVTLLNTPEDAVVETTAYVFYCTLGIPMIFIYNAIGSVFRGLGDSRTPLIAVGIACAVNIVGDLVFVAGCDMGAAGAAIATVIAQCISVGICAWILKKQQILGDDFTWSQCKISGAYMKRVLGLGVPVAVQSVLANFSVLIFTMIVNEHGIITSAAIGLADKVTGLTILIPTAFMQALAVFVAQNYGAKRYDRVRAGFRICLGINSVIGCITALSIFFFGDKLVRIFNQDQELIEATYLYLKGFALDTFLAAVQFTLVGYYNGFGKTTFVMFQSIVGAVVRISLVYYISLGSTVSLMRMGFATPMATSCQITCCLIFFVYLRRKLKEEISSS